MEGKKLTHKQRLFCLEYLKDLNATQAAIRAGYSEKTAKDIGCENLAKPNIQEMLSVLMAERSEKTKIDAEWVLLRAVELHDRCSQASAVTDRDGAPVLDDAGRPIYKFEHTGVSKALELIGKHVDIQAFKEKVESTNVNMSHEEWISSLK